jgi:hypothetical protein
MEHGRARLGRDERTSGRRGGLDRPDPAHEPVVPAQLELRGGDEQDGRHGPES